MTAFLFFAVLAAEPIEVALTTQEIAAMGEATRVLTQQTDMSLAPRTAQRCEEALKLNKGLVAGLSTIKQKYQLSVLEDKVLTYDCFVYVAGKMNGGLDALASAAKDKIESK